MRGRRGVLGLVVVMVVALAPAAQAQTGCIPGDPGLRSAAAVPLPPENPACDLPPPTRFSDVVGSPHAGAIARVVAAGIAGGYGDGRYGTNDVVTRGQMAAFLVRAFEL